VTAPAGSRPLPILARLRRASGRGSLARRGESEQGGANGKGI